MPGTIYSHSRLQAYENCPLRYKYLYIDRLDRKRRDSIEAFMGNRVHETMERLYSDLNYAKINSFEELLAYYRSCWDKRWSDDIVIVREQYTPAHYRELDERCIRGYYKRHHPFDRLRRLELERPISITLPGRYRLTGVIDRLAQHPDGAYAIHDYKTSETLPGQSDVDADRQ